MFCFWTVKSGGFEILFWRGKGDWDYYLMDVPMMMGGNLGRKMEYPITSDFVSHHYSFFPPRFPLKAR